MATEECAHEVLEVVPKVMHAIRSHMRSYRTPDLSVPQFRTLAFLDRREGACLSTVAEDIGLALPSMSKLVDGLVERDLVTREGDPIDRRRVRLRLTVHGRQMLQAARAATQGYIAAQLATLSPDEQATVAAAMQALRVAFAPNGRKGWERA